jgi:hypothetical protein
MGLFHYLAFEMNSAVPRRLGIRLVFLPPDS